MLTRIQRLARRAILQLQQLEELVSCSHTQPLTHQCSSWSNSKVGRSVQTRNISSHRRHFVKTLSPVESGSKTKGMESSVVDSSSHTQEQTDSVADSSCNAQEQVDSIKVSDFSVSMETSDVNVGQNSKDVCSKRSVDEVSGETDASQAVKKAKVDTQRSDSEDNHAKETETKPASDRVVRKKFAMLMVYSGTGYNGMQRNPPFPTIEEDLLSALHKIEAITDDQYNTPQKMKFQRAARTDKGVSALGQVVSLQLPVGRADLIERVNELLPEQIRVLGLKRCTKGFNSKNHCMARTYSYVCPTFAFAPLDQKTTEAYRVTDKVFSEVNRILGMYKGTHKFHNFTSGKLPSDPSARRYIMEFKCSLVYEKDGIEFTVMKVKGQSFMLHQIRKMIGLMIAVVRGMATEAAIEQAWQPEKSDIPIAPALGLMLEQLHYDGYNKRFGTDGIHDPITWDEYQEEIEAFKHKFVYPNIVQIEKEEKSMLNWLGTLMNHTFDGCREADGRHHSSAFYKARKNVDSLNTQESSTSADEERSSEKEVTSSQSETVERSENQSESSTEHTETPADQQS